MYKYTYQLSKKLIYKCLINMQYIIQLIMNNLTELEPRNIFIPFIIHLSNITMSNDIWLSLAIGIHKQIPITLDILGGKNFKYCNDGTWIYFPMKKCIRGYCLLSIELNLHNDTNILRWKVTIRNRNNILTYYVISDYNTEDVHVEQYSYSEISTISYDIDKWNDNYRKNDFIAKPNMFYLG